jgi:hypothetical protein
LAVDAGHSSGGAYTNIIHVKARVGNRKIGGEAEADTEVGSGIAGIKDNGLFLPTSADAAIYPAVIGIPISTPVIADINKSIVKPGFSL